MKLNILPMRKISLLALVACSVLLSHSLQAQVDSVGIRALENGTLEYAHANGHITFYKVITEDYAISQIATTNDIETFLFDAQNLPLDTIDIQGFINILIIDPSGKIFLETGDQLISLEIKNSQFQLLSTIENGKENYVYKSASQKLYYLKKGKKREWYYEAYNEKPKQIFSIDRKEQRGHNSYGPWGTIIEPVYFFNDNFYFSNSYDNSVIQFDTKSKKTVSIDIKHDSLYSEGNVFLLFDEASDIFYIINYTENTDRFKLFRFHPDEGRISLLNEYDIGSFPPSSIFGNYFYSIGRFNNQVSIFKNRIKEEDIDFKLMHE